MLKKKGFPQFLSKLQNTFRSPLLRPNPMTIPSCFQRQGTNTCSINIIEFSSFKLPCTPDSYKWNEKQDQNEFYY